MATPRINTKAYSNSHRRQPRGTGMWMFASQDQFDRYAVQEMFSGHFRSYGEAAKAAKAHYQGQADEIYVMP